MVDERVADVGNVLRGGGLDQVAAAGGDSDNCPPLIGEASLACHQAAVFHPAQVLGQAALLPAQQPAKLERPQPTIGRLGEMGQDLVVGVGKPAPVTQLPANVLAAELDPGLGRRVIFIATDTPEAGDRIAELVADLGLAAVQLGRIDEGGRLIQAPNALVLRNLIERPLF
jgi:hypothetical protein